MNLCFFCEPLLSDHSKYHRICNYAGNRILHQSGKGNKLNDEVMQVTEFYIRTVREIKLNDEVRSFNKGDDND